MNMRRTCRRTCESRSLSSGVERLHAGDEQQGEELQHALGRQCSVAQGVVEQVAEVAVEFLVGLFGDVGAGLAPQRGALVGRLVLAVAGDGDRQGDVVGPFADDGFQPHGIEIFLRVRLDVQHDVGAGGFARRPGQW